MYYKYKEILYATRQQNKYATRRQNLATSQAQIADIDAIVMGRNTFQQVLSFEVWPYTKPVYVISSSLNKLPDEYSGRAQILNLNPSDIIEKLHSDGLKNLYIDGGALIQSFLAEDLIDELIITTIPIVLGAGIPLFSELSTVLKFKHQKTEVLLNSLVKSHYLRQR
jgi:dihydrofolate reductase